VSRKLQIVLPDPLARELQELAAGAGEPLATAARRVLRDGLAAAAKGGEVRASRLRPIERSRRSDRPRWLEPHGGDSEWRRETWGAVVALHARYPRHLQGLQTGWWTDESQAETLCALAVWRAEIDDAGQDPREELAFQHQLADHAHTLRQQGGGVERTWHPGAPPEDWIVG